MRRFHILLISSTLLGAGFHPAPSSAFSGAAGQKITVTDFRGKQISLDKPAERIVCLIESALSGIYMLGAEHRVVGISTNVYQGSVFPHYAAMDERIRKKALPTPGNWDFVNIENVVVLQPDLVVIWSHQEESIRTLEEKGIPVFGVFIERFEDVHREILALGKLTNTSQRAEELIRHVREALGTIREKTSVVADEKRTRVYYMWAQGELETSGKNSTVTELIALAGGENVAGGIEQEHLVVNRENILIWNPEVVVMWYNTRKDPTDIMANPVWRSVAAVQNRRVHEFPDVFSCDLWTLKYLFAVEMAARWCYPAPFARVDLSAARVDLFRTLYDGRLPISVLAEPVPEERIGP